MFFVFVSLGLIYPSLCEERYILYDVNYGEGFNLRRDVYLRISNTIRQLRENGLNYTLILPEWRYLPHWRRTGNVDWQTFFDLDSLSTFIPVVEYKDFVEKNGDVFENVLYLQHYEDWSSRYEDRFGIEDCRGEIRTYEKSANKWVSLAHGFRTNEFQCLSIRGDSSTLVKALIQLSPNAKFIVVDRAETILHDHFGDQHYWAARRSMRYARRLIDIANKFRSEILNSTDAMDKTVLASSWEEQRPDVGSAVGGDYLCAHWRRRDFLYAHKESVPTVKGTVKQLVTLLKRHNLKSLFVATDAPKEEFWKLSEEISQSGFSVSRYVASNLSDGELSIIDQWICAHSRIFIGTHHSTFSYRIHEDREILGFSPNATFRCLCSDDEENCEQPTKWTITY